MNRLLFGVSIPAFVFLASVTAHAQLNCRALFTDRALHRASVESESRIEEGRLDVIKTSAAVGITIPAELRPRFEAVLGQVRNLLSTRDRNAENAIEANLKSLLNDVMHAPANAEIFDLSRGDRDRDLMIYLVRYSNPEYRLPIETVASLFVSDVASTSGLFKGYGRESLDAAISLDRFTRRISDRYSLNKAKETELARMSEREIHEREAYLRDQLEELNVRFIAKAKLPSAAEELIARLIATSSPNTRAYENHDVVDAVEQRLNAGLPADGNRWHLSTLWSSATGLLNSPTLPNATKASYVRRLIIEDNLSMLMPTDALRYRSTVNDELSTIGTIRGHMRRR